MAIGKNPTLPSSSQDDLPALEGHTSSPVIAQHLNVIAAARRAFIEADLSLKLRGALKHRVHVNILMLFSNKMTLFFINYQERTAGKDQP